MNRQTDGLLPSVPRRLENGAIFRTTILESDVTNVSLWRK